MARIRKKGGYRELRSFQITTVIYDATCRFCERFIDVRSRTKDQMVQAARSGRQNIAEGSRAAGSSSLLELRLVNVARASLEELLLDMEDFLRHRQLRQWSLNAEEALAVRRVGWKKGHLSDRTDPTDLADKGHAPTRVVDEWHYALYARWLDHKDPMVCANALICLIHQANYLLDLQLEALEGQFVKEGGYREQLAVARLEERKRQSASANGPGLAATIPDCPRCSSPMVLRTARKGKRSGESFWGCSRYPECDGVVPSV